MTNTKRLTSALVLSIAASCITLPAYARTASSFDANLQAIGPQLAARAAQRMAAIRACNEAAAPLRGDAERGKHSDRHRACMAEHGQRE